MGFSYLRSDLPILLLQFLCVCIFVKMLVSCYVNAWTAIGFLNGWTSDKGDNSDGGGGGDGGILNSKGRFKKRN